MVSRQLLLLQWQRLQSIYNKEYKGKVIIDDKLKAAIDAYYDIYGVKQKRLVEK